MNTCSYVGFLPPSESVLRSTLMPIYDKLCKARFRTVAAIWLRVARNIKRSPSESNVYATRLAVMPPRTSDTSLICYYTESNMLPFTSEIGVPGTRSSFALRRPSDYRSSSESRVRYIISHVSAYLCRNKHTEWHPSKRNVRSGTMMSFHRTGVCQMRAILLSQRISVASSKRPTPGTAPSCDQVPKNSSHMHHSGAILNTRRPRHIEHQRRRKL